MQRRDLLRTTGAAGAALTLPPSVATAASGSTALQETFEPRDRIEIDGAAEVVVGDDGETAYLAATTGFVTVDVTDPDDLSILAERLEISVDDRRLTQILDVSVDGDRLAVVGPGDMTDEDVFRGIALYDVSDPADPAVVDSYETGFAIHNCFLADDLLYVVYNAEDDTALVIYDASDDDIEEVGRWSLLDYDPDLESVHWRVRYLHDVFVRDGIAYLPFWDAGTYLVDVGDPSEPEYVSHVRDPDVDLEGQSALPYQEAQFGLPGNDHYAAVDDAGDLLAVGREAWATGGDDPDGPGGIDLYDVSDPAAPELRASIDPPESDSGGYYGGHWTTAHNFELRDDRLYSAWYQGGVKIHDVSDPAAPERLAHWRDDERAGFWTLRVADGGETALASSTPLIPNGGTEGALYAFPTLADESDDSSESDDDDDDDDDPVPGFTGAAGVAGLTGGAVALEWLRRTRADDR